MLSFTNTAVKEFKFATAEIGRGALHEPHFVGTLDSFIERFILGPFGHLVSQRAKRPKIFLSPRPGDQKGTKWNLRIQTKTGFMPVYAWKILPRRVGVDTGFYVRQFSTYKELPRSQALALVEALFKRGEYSHDQRAYWAERLLREFPAIAKILSRRFPEIIVDEAQDTGIWHLELLRILRSHGSKITLVGDPDQCIYEFGQASVATLTNCKTEWQLYERPLNKSFRCNDVIAAAVRQISGNTKFEGAGPARSDLEGAFVFNQTSDNFSAVLEAFRKRAAELGIAENECAILCRAHDQMTKIRGVLRYTTLQGKTKRLAEAAFLRDQLGDFAGAMKEVFEVLTDLCPDEALWTEIEEKPQSDAAIEVRTKIWKFVRSEAGLPTIAQIGGEWLPTLRIRIEKLLRSLGIQTIPNLNKQLGKKGMGDEQLPLFTQDAVFPELRFDTIHKAKGETIDAVLLIGSDGFFDELAEHVSSGAESENKRLGYVAMTRAKHFLCVALPAKHHLQHSRFWSDRGFRSFP